MIPGAIKQALSKLANLHWKVFHVLFLWLFCMALSSSSFAQREADNWYFGYVQAVNFASGNPVHVNGSNMAADYGSTSLSDSLGNLLFYSDGNELFNRNNFIMPHGDSLLSNGYATSPCVAFRMPGSLRKYYIFTVAGAPTTKWVPCVNYSVIDMNLNGGLGDIIAFQKNIPLMAADSAYETISAVKHGSLDAYWVFVRNHGTPNKIYAFLVDITGVHTTPVVSTCYLNFTVTEYGQTEIVKISPDGKYLLYAARNAQSGQYGKVEIYTIDNLTGQVSQKLLFDTGKLNMGAEFSANSEYLYTSNSVWNFTLSKHITEIRQYDVKKIDDLTQFQNSAIIMGSDTLVWCYTTQLLANNGKIYFLHTVGDPPASQTSYLGVINYPYLLGTSCGLQFQAVQLSQPSLEGLPTFVSSYAALFDWTGNCVADSVSFHSHFYPPPNAFLWNFGDPSSGSANTSTLANPKHIFYSPGQYTVSVKAVFPNGTAETATRDITVSAGPNIEIGDTIYLCPGDSVSLSPGNGFTQYLWSTGSTASTIYAKNPGIYWVQVHNLGDCASMDSVLVINYPGITLNTDSLVVSPTTCGGSTGAITGLKVSGTNPVTLTWTEKISGQVVGHGSNLFNLGVGLYELSVTDGNGCKMPAVSYVIKDVGDIMIDTVTSIRSECKTSNGSINVIAVSGLGSRIQYFLKSGNDTISQWHHGDFPGLATGIYYVWVTDSSGCTSVYSKPIMISNPPGPQVTGAIQIPATYQKSDGKIILTATSTGDTLLYSLNGGLPQVNNGTFGNLASGQYTCTITDENGCDTTFTLDVGEIYGIRLEAIAGDGSVCLGNVAVLPLQANSFSHVSAFDSRLKYNKAQVTCQNYLNANPALADSLQVDLFPTLGEISLTWTGKNPVNLADGSTLVELSFASLNTGQDSLKWDISPGICTFLDSLGNVIAPEFKQGQVRVYSIPQGSIQAPETICEGSDLSLIGIYTPGSGNGPISYQWSGPDGFTDTNPVTFINGTTMANAGEYLLNLADTNHCQGQASFQLNVIPTPVADFSKDTVYFDQQTEIQARPGYAWYAWSTGDSTSSITISAEGWYKVMIRTAEGCTTVDSLMALFSFAPFNMPNAFSPNADGYNDQFRPVTLPEKVQSFSMYIYDRWGRQVYTTKDLGNGWNGSIDGKPAPVGVYTYIISYGNQSGEVRKKTGMVTLVR